MMDKYYIIYRTTNLLNGRYYIGMHITTNIDDGYFGSGRRIKAEIKKYGRGNFERVVLEQAQSKKDLASREAELVTEKLRSDPLCLNLKNGGEGGGRIWSEAHRIAFLAGSVKSGKKAVAGKIGWYDEARRKAAGRKTGLMTGRVNGPVNQHTTRTPKARAKRIQTMKDKCHQQGSSNSQFNSCWVTKENKSTKIKAIDLDKFLSEGFVRGRIMK